MGSLKGPIPDLAEDGDVANEVAGACAAATSAEASSASAAVVEKPDAGRKVSNGNAANGSSAPAPDAKAAPQIPKQNSFQRKTLKSSLRQRHCLQRYRRKR